jgi:hypothetical protein
MKIMSGSNMENSKNWTYSRDRVWSDRLWRKLSNSRRSLHHLYHGPIGAVDRHLIETGKLKHLSTVEMLEKIPLVKTVRDEKASTDHSGGAAQRVKTFIVERIIERAAKGVG